MEEIKKGKRVMVAMSGGVDSAVAALLLQRQGYEVVGVTCQIWLADICNVESNKSCCGNEAVDDARGTATRLGVKHYVFNYRELFRTKVIDNFCEEYLEGKTPNPCMNCNLHIRSIDLLDRALSLGFDYLATGHYVRNEFDEESGEYVLRRGLDATKDQSYFLYQLSQEKLSHLLFPLGSLTKKEVRQIAKEADIPVANKAESQDICFVPNGDYGSFIEEYRNVKGNPSQIWHRNGAYLGQGKALYRYTIGQRKGLGIAWETPLYVISIDVDGNRVTVGGIEDTFCAGLVAGDVYRISEEAIPDGTVLLAKVRYRSKPSKAIFSNQGEGFRVHFLDPTASVTLGQSAVLYALEDPDRVLGGGRIQEVLHD